MSCRNRFCHTNKALLMVNSSWSTVCSEKFQLQALISAWYFVQWRNSWKRPHPPIYFGHTMAVKEASIKSGISTKNYSIVTSPKVTILWADLLETVVLSCHCFDFLLLFIYNRMVGREIVVYYFTLCSLVEFQCVTFICYACYIVQYD